MKIAFRLDAPVLILIILLSACSGGSDDTPGAPTAQATQVVQPSPTSTTPPSPIPTSTPAEDTVLSVLTDRTLEDLMIPVGTTIIWSNEDSEFHTITSGSRDNHGELWDSGIMDTGISFSFTFDEAGVFPYLCTIHPIEMVGTITVVGDEATLVPTMEPTATATALVATVTAATPTSTSVSVGAATPTVTAVALPTATATVEATSTVEVLVPTPTATSTAAATATATATMAATAAPPSDITSEILNFRLQDLNVADGTTVTWVNLDRAPHTSTSGVSPTQSGTWNSAFLDQGQEFSFTFNQAGTFPYFCRVHPSMTGTVTVTPN